MTQKSMLTSLEDEMIGKDITKEKAEMAAKVHNEFSWPNDKVRAVKLVGGWGKLTHKLVINRGKYEGEYPMAEDAALIGYKPAAQLHIEVAPDVFLWYATWQSMESFQTPSEFKKSPVFSKYSYESIKGRWDTGKDLDPLFLDLDYKNGVWRPVSHEGRHRAVVAHDKGVEKVPVAVFTRVDGVMTPIHALDDEAIDKLRRTLNRWKGVAENGGFGEAAKRKTGSSARKPVRVRSYNRRRSHG